MPNSITHLTLGYHFNKSVDKLPESLEKLTFGDYFDQEVDLKYLSKLTHLIFGRNFNK